jgi:hypothetical protein
VVGNDRSGTTMLRLILDRSVEAAVPTESMIVTDFAPIRRGHWDLSAPGTLERFVRRVWTHPKIRQWRLPSSPPVPPPGLSHIDAYRWAVETPFRAYAEREGKDRFGDKTPAYLGHVDEIFAVWPDAKLLVMVRDGRDVALSVRRLPFGANNVYSAATDWVRGIRAGRAAEHRHPGSVLTVKYEDFVSDPIEELRRVCEFLSLTFSDDMLRLDSVPRSKLAQDQQHWFAKIWRGIDNSSVGKWRLEMSLRDQRIFDAVARTELTEMGYDVSSVPAAGMLSNWQLSAYRTHDAAWRLGNFVRLRLVRERGAEVPYVVRRKLGRL